MEVKKDNLKPNTVYAVQFTIDTRKYHGRNGKQRGIIVTNDEGKIYLSWNMVRPDRWSSGEIELFNKHHIHEANEMEVQFAFSNNAYRDYRERCVKLTDLNADLQCQINYYKQSRLHRIAEFLCRIF